MDVFSPFLETIYSRLNIVEDIERKTLFSEDSDSISFYALF